MYPAQLTPGGPALSVDLLKTCDTELLQRSDAKLLLIGCRHGEHLLALAGQFAGMIVGIDDDPEAVLYARMALADARLASRVQARIMSPLATNFPEAHFDIVMLEGAFSKYPPGKVMKEAARILSGGGVLLFSDSCWLEENVPVFAREVWEDRDHKILTMEALSAQIANRGFTIRRISDHSNVLGPFYRQFRDTAHGIARTGFEGMKHLKTLVKHYKHEIDVYHKHGGNRYMGYVTVEAVREQTSTSVSDADATQE
jgi:SAM-dependent methyltransferase